MAPPDAAPVRVRAPGRINLIGEHTDYEEGYVLPAATDAGLTLRSAPRPDGRVLLGSEAFPGTAEFLVGSPLPRGGAAWAAPAAALLSLMRKTGLPVSGFEGRVGGDLPPGAGLSSSAAFLVAVGLSAWCAAGAAPPGEAEREALALLCRDAEERARGVRCGIMDPFASLLGRADEAFLLDCRTRRREAVALDGARLSLLVADSGVRHDLAAGGYNTRRAECSEAARRLGVAALRDATPEQVEAARSRLGETLRRRARHVVTENARTLAAVGALRRGDLPGFGRLLAESHASLRDDFEVSIPETDCLAESAAVHPGVYGARLMGGGFGGGVLVAAAAGEEDAVAEAVREAFRARFARVVAVRRVRPAAGAAAELRCRDFWRPKAPGD